MMNYLNLSTKSILRDQFHPGLGSMAFAGKYTRLFRKRLR
jgi:hypothetical protein